MGNAVVVNDLSLDYSGERALQSITFGIATGALFGIIGADGAGKSTLLRILTTLVAPDTGTASVISYDIRSGFHHVRTAIGYMPQRFSLYEDLTVRENMHFFADIFNIRGKERTKRVQRLLGFSRLEPFQNRRAGQLSGGMKQKLALSCALIHTPALVILDEPTTGVDPVSRKEFWHILKELHTQGITIVIATPYMEEAEYCSDLILLHHGKIIRQGTPLSLIDRYPLRLFRIESPDTVLHYPQNNTLPDRIRLLYPSRGSLHAAVDNADLDELSVLAQVKKVVPAAVYCTQIQPRIEDVFFLALVDKKAQDSGPVQQER